MEKEQFESVKNQIRELVAAHTFTTDQGRELIGLVVARTTGKNPLSVIIGARGGIAGGRLGGKAKTRAKKAASANNLALARERLAAIRAAKKQSQ